MKTMLLAASAAAALIATAGAASAQEAGWYVRGDVGGDFSSRINGNNPAKGDSGVAVDLGVGHSFANGLRLEGEVAYQQADGKTAATGDLKTTSAFLNAYYDFAKGTAWQPYVGAGVGFGQVKLDGTAIHDDDTQFAYQVKVGIAHPFNDRLTGDLGYRYTGIPSVKIGTGAGAVDGDYGASAVTVGLRYKFGA